MNKQDRTQIRFELLESHLETKPEDVKTTILLVSDLKNEVCGTATIEKPTTETPTTPTKEESKKGTIWTQERRDALSKKMKLKHKQSKKAKKVILKKLDESPKSNVPYLSTVDVSKMSHKNIERKSAEKIASIKSDKFEDALFPTSKVLTKATYYPQTKILEVKEVQSKRLLKFYDVPKKTFEELKNKPQPGIFYTKHIKPIYAQVAGKVLVKN